MHFAKMQGTGNDYVCVDSFRERMPADPAKLSIAIADRHFGVGGDGLILICPSAPCQLAPTKACHFAGVATPEHPAPNPPRAIPQGRRILLAAIRN